MAEPSSVWQRFHLCPIESNGNENFKVIQNPGFLPDHSQNWITGSFCHSWHSQEISEDPYVTFWVILLTHRQTDKVCQKHYLLGGGNNWLLDWIAKKTTRTLRTHLCNLPQSELAANRFFSTNTSSHISVFNRARSAFVSACSYWIF